MTQNEVTVEAYIISLIRRHPVFLAPPNGKYPTFFNPSLIQCISFKKLDQHWTTLGGGNFFCAHFSTIIFFLQNDSEWLEMDFKHNFIKCNILTPHNVTFVTFFFFFEGVH